MKNNRRTQRATGQDLGGKQVSARDTFQEKSMRSDRTKKHEDVAHKDAANKTHAEAAGFTVRKVGDLSRGASAARRKAYPDSEKLAIQRSKDDLKDRGYKGKMR